MFLTLGWQHPRNNAATGANLFNNAVMAESLADERGGCGRNLRGC